MSYNPARSSALADKKREEAMVTASGKIHHWTREEYEQAVERGAFEGWRVELVDGVLCDMSPQSGPHAGAIDRIAEELRSHLGTGFRLRQQMPLSLTDDSVPEPDIALVARDPQGDFYSSGHPRTAFLVVEVADSSLPFDRNHKQRLYARAGIPEYWIVNLSSRRLEVYRDPGSDSYGKCDRPRAGGLGLATRLARCELCSRESLPEAVSFWRSHS